MSRPRESYTAPRLVVSFSFILYSIHIKPTGRTNMKLSYGGGGCNISSPEFETPGLVSVTWQWPPAHLLPHLGRKSCSLNHFHVEETLTCERKQQYLLTSRWFRTAMGVNGGCIRRYTLLLSDGGVLAVGQRTRWAVTQAGDAVFITTEVLTLGPENRDENFKINKKNFFKSTAWTVRSSGLAAMNNLHEADGVSDLLDFEGAELFVPNNIPDHLQEVDGIHHQRSLGDTSRKILHNILISMSV